NEIILRYAIVIPAVSVGKLEKFLMIQGAKKKISNERIKPVVKRNEKAELKSLFFSSGEWLLTYSGKRAGEVDSLKKSKIIINTEKEKKYASDISDAPKRYAISSFSRKPSILVDRWMDDIYAVSLKMLIHFIRTYTIT
ncbi:MAG: hypothetical protein ABFR36_10220, partial [Acidobacteriota bacterium]